MSFIKTPEKNPELIMDCFILALGHLGYSAENVNQPPASVVMNDKIHLELFDSKHWAQLWILKRINHFFKRIGVDGDFKHDNRLCYGDLICPRSRRFITILGHLLNVIIFKSELDPQIEAVDLKCREMQDELDQKERRRADLEQKIKDQRPYQQQILAEIDNLKKNIRTTEAKVKVDQQNLQKSKDNNEKLKHESEEMNEKIEILTAEIKMLGEEKTRLEELVVKNPDEWESNFQKMKSEIVDTEEHVSWLKDEIPRIQSDFRSIQKFGTELSNLVKKLEEVKSSMVEKTEIEKAQKSTKNSIQIEQKELDKMETSLKLLRQSHQMELNKANGKIESLKDHLEQKKSENKELSDIIRGIKNELKTIETQIENQESIKNDIDYHKPKIERRSKAYEDELTKMNGECERYVKKTEKKLVAILKDSRY